MTELGAWAGDAEGGTSEDMERKRLSEGHSPSRDHRLRWWDLLGQGKKLTT